MKQLEGFIEAGKEHLVRTLNRSIYDLKQTSRQQYLKFDVVVSEFGYVENQVDEYVCPHEIKGKYFIYMILYVDDTLLASMSLSLLNNTKVFLSKNFDTKDLGEAFYVLGIEIKRHSSRYLLGLSQQNNINKVQKIRNAQRCWWFLCLKETS